jgi:hypothetical protein
MLILTKYLPSVTLFFLLCIGSAVYFDDVLSLKGSIPGFGLDPFFCMFVIHTNALKFLALDFQGIVNLPFFYPKAHTLAFSDPLLFHSILYLVFYKIFEVKDLCIRLMFFSFFILNWIACSVFLYQIRKKIITALFVGWLFAFSLFLQVQSAHYQNLIVFPIFLSIIPLFKLTLYNRSKFLLTFFGTFLMVISNLYFFIYGLIVFFSIAILYSIYRGRFFLIKSKYAFFGCVVAGLFALPIIQYYYSVKIEYPEIVGVRNFDEKVSFSARPSDFFKVLYPPFLYFDLKKYFVSYEFERTNFSGLLGMMIFTGLSLPYLKFTKFKTLKPQLLSIFLFAIGVFLVSGPLIFPPIYKLASMIVPGLSEIRAVGRAGLIINIAYVVSIFIFIAIPKIKNFFYYTFITLVILILIGERITIDFPTRFVQLNLPINEESLQLVKDENIENIDTKSIFVLTETVEDFIRIPFYLSIESGIATVNGYSGYNPSEWNHTNLLFSQVPDCKQVVRENRFLFDHASYLLIERQSPFFKNCLLELRDFQITSQSMNLALYINKSKIIHDP